MLGEQKVGQPYHGVNSNKVMTQEEKDLEDQFQL